MALVIQDRVRETTQVVGTGSATLLGAVTGYQSFSVIGNASTTYYTIADQGGPNWEVGLGTWSTGGTLARTTVLASSNSGSLVNFTTGTKDVFVTYPTEEAIYNNGTSIVGPTGSSLAVANGGTGATTLTANGVIYGNGTGAVGVTAVGTTGQVLVGNTGAAPSWATVSSSLVSSFSAGTTGFTPSTATTGAVTLSGTLNVANGGTGLTTLTANYIPYGNGTSAFSSSANMTFNGTTLTLANDASISGLTVGLGAGSIATNTAFGLEPLFSNTTGSFNVAIGRYAMYANTTGVNNATFGRQALQNNTSGVENTATGNLALYSNTTGSSNVALGFASLNANTTASYNTAVGYQAGYSNVTGAYNTFVGYQAGYTSAVSSATAGNTCVGYQTGYSLTTGAGNTFVGSGTTYAAGAVVTSGSKNTILGAYSGNNGGLDIRTSDNYIVLSDGDGNPRAYCSTSGYWYLSNSVSNGQSFYSYNTSATNPYGMEVGLKGASPNGAGNWFIYCSDTTAQRASINSNGGLTNYQANNTNLSDAREKKNIELSGNYLDKLCQIPVKTFLFNDQTDEDLNLGVIAQDVQAICPELITESNWALKNEPEKMRLTIYQTDLQYAMLKAIQELNAKVEAQAVEIATLKGK